MGSNSISVRGVSREITVRCEAFAREGVRPNRVLVERDGTVRVWDAVAGHYTICHALGTAAQRRIRRLAEVAS